MSFFNIVRRRLLPDNSVFGPFIRHHNFPADESQNTFPLSGLLMHNLLAESPFWELSYTSQVSILVQGSNRYCSERRAEAIMAAVGIVNWYNLDASDDKEDQLVLAMYPLDFVIEAARKVGPQFATVVKRIGSPIHSLNYFLGSCRGFMLPFAATDPASKGGARDVKHAFITTDLDKEWNPCFNSWEFLQNGSVVMKKAAVLGKQSSGKIRMHARVRVLLHWQPRGFDSLEVELDVSLKRWLSQQSNGFSLLSSKDGC